MLRAIRFALAIAALAGCSASSSGGAAAPTPAPACAPEDTTGDDGACIGPGVPPDGCDPGFTYDANGGCDPILPATPCGEGEMAVPGDTECYAVGAAGDPPTCASGQVALPGETACHALADCGSGPWGDIPVDATTQYVDGSYSGGASDGSVGKPWTSIGAAVTAATSGAVIAVAQGSYAESVAISGKAVRLWGRCPSLVAIAGVDATTAAVTLGPSTDDTEIHTIALTGAGTGAALGTVRGVLLDSVWVHDTASDGIDGAGSATLRGSLVERSTHLGISLQSADLALDTSVVRDVAAAADGSLGSGLDATSGSKVTVTGSLFERNHSLQLAIFGSDATIDGCVIRDGQPNPIDMTDGAAIYAGFEARPTALTLLASTLERHLAASIAISGSDVVIQGTLIRDTLSAASDGIGGYGIQAEPYSPTQPSRVAVRGSLLERNHSIAAAVSGGSLTLDHCVVRDTSSQESDGIYGLAAEAQDDATTKLRGSLAITGSLLERNRAVALNVIGSDGTVDATLVRDTLPRQSDGTGGHGVEVATDGPTKQRGTLKLTGSVITGNRDLGVATFSADLVIDRSVVSSTQTSATAGYGVEAEATPPGAGRATLTLTRSLVADSVGIGIALGSVDATVSQVWIRGVTPRLSDGAFGDGIAADTGAVLTASSCRIEGSARAGLSMFDTAQVTLGSATLACDAIPLDGEGQSSFTASGNVVCSCAGATSACQVVSSNLQPPPPITPGAP